MLPSNVKNILKIGKWCFDGSYDSQKGEFVVTQEDKIFFLNKLKVKCCDSAFIDFYSVVGFTPLGQGSELSTLDQILEDNEAAFWGDEYPELSKRYLRISSIEAQHSYFYDKETDAVYDVGWEDMDDFAAGSLEPQWKSFYDFLEWYYSDQEEE